MKNLKSLTPLYEVPFTLPIVFLQGRMLNPAIIHTCTQRTIWQGFEPQQAEHTRTHTDIHTPHTQRDSCRTLLTHPIQLSALSNKLLTNQNQMWWISVTQRSMYFGQMKFSQSYPWFVIIIVITLENFVTLLIKLIPCIQNNGDFHLIWF